MVMNSFGQHIRAIWHFPPPKLETRLLPGRSGVWDWASATPETLISPNLLSSSVIQLNLACRTATLPRTVVPAPARILLATWKTGALRCRGLDGVGLRPVGVLGQHRPYDP